MSFRMLLVLVGLGCGSASGSEVDETRTAGFAEELNAMQQELLSTHESSPADQSVEAIEQAPAGGLSMDELQADIDHAVANNLPVPIPLEFVEVVTGKEAAQEKAADVARSGAEKSSDIVGTGEVAWTVQRSSGQSREEEYTREANLNGGDNASVKSGVIVEVSDDLAELDPLLDESDKPIISDTSRVVTSYTRRVPVNSGEQNKIFVDRYPDGSLTSSRDTVPVLRPTRAVADKPLSPLTGTDYVSEDGLPLTDTSLSDVGGLTGVSPRSASDFDPLRTMVRWKWKGISVGESIRRVASFAGYNLVVRDEVAKGLYSMPLPASHEQVSGIDTETALGLLAGPGFTLVIDHVSRTVQHVVKPDYLIEQVNNLPLCPGNVTSAVQFGNSWIIDGGVRCVYQGRVDQLQLQR